MQVEESNKMGLWQCIALVTGNLVGSGVFLLPAKLALYGTYSLLGWLITAVGALFLALTFAALSAQVHGVPGGPHVFVERAFGRELGFWTAWGYWLLTWSSNTVLLITAVEYLTIITGEISLTWILVIQAVIWALILAINLRGVQIAARFEMLITVLKLLPIVVIPLAALLFVHWSNFSLDLPNANMSWVSALQQSVFLSLWAFVGVESATVPSNEVVDPQKTIAVATIGGTLIAGLVYVLGSVATIGVLGVDVISSSTAVYAALAQTVMGGQWGVIIAASVTICCVGTFHGWSLCVARIAQGAAQQGLFPAVFARTDKAATPVYSLVISSLCTLCCVVFTLQQNRLAQFNAIVDIAVTLILIIYLACSLAYFKLVKPTTWQGYAIGLGALLFAIAAICANEIATLLYALLLLCSGMVFRVFMTIDAEEMPVN